MRCEVVAVGTELLLGQIVDTNSAWIGERLARAGVDCHFQTRVGDNIERIVVALQVALGRSDAVVVCGGLGPTPDDVTREALSVLLGVPLVRDDEVLARIRALFAGRGRAMASSNERQADVPVGATVIEQRRGTAPGLICPVGSAGGAGARPDAAGGSVIYAVPGVPREMTEMVERAVVPDLEARMGQRSAIVSRVLRVWGEAESALAERLASRLAALDAAGNPTIAFLASGIEGIQVRITAKATTAEAAAAVLDAEEADLRSVLGEQVFGVDDQTMESAVAGLLGEYGLTLGLAESMTGGLIASRLTSVPGASTWFRGGVVSYAGEVKFDLLGVPPGPVVSEPAARAMAEGARRVLGADVGLAVTGVAGPGDHEGVPAGTVVVGLALAEASEASRLRLPGDRVTVTQLGAISALDVLRRRLLHQAGEASG